MPSTSDGLDSVHTAIKNKVASKKKRSFAEHKQRKAEQRQKQKDRKDEFYQQMMSVTEDSSLPDLPKSVEKPSQKSLFTSDDSLCLQTQMT